MARIANDSVVTIYFEFTWTSSHAVHVERFLAKDVDFTRDILPLGVKSRMRGLGEGDSVELAMDSAEVPPFKPGKILDMPATRFVGSPDLGRRIKPRIGRFYPKHYIDNVPGTRPDSASPFRISETDKAGFKANLNHPMADRDVVIKATAIEVKDASQEAGVLHRWPDLFFQGPGLQARLPETPTDFLGWEPFRRKVDSNDADFYATFSGPEIPGIEAEEGVQKVYGSAVQDGAIVLDLMAGKNSHIPEGVEPVSVIGMGLSKSDMEANPALTEHVIHNLNEEPVLPFETDSFDAVICTAGVEYLTSPFEIIEEAGRLLKPGGVFSLVFTEQWVKEKVIGIWPELYPFERMGLVSQYFVRSEMFENIWTSSDRSCSESEVFGVWAKRIVD